MMRKIARSHIHMCGSSARPWRHLRGGGSVPLGHVRGSAGDAAREHQLEYDEDDDGEPEEGDAEADQRHLTPHQPTERLARLSVRADGVVVAEAGAETRAELVDDGTEPLTAAYRPLPLEAEAEAQVVDLQDVRATRLAL